MNSHQGQSNGEHERKEIPLDGTGVEVSRNWNPKESSVNFRQDVFGHSQL